MMNLEDINLLGLPFKFYSEKSQLPETSGVYFVMDQSDVLLYIGRSKNIKHRWVQHHRRDQFRLLPDVKIAWVAIDKRDLLAEREKEFIQYFNPVNQRKFVNTDNRKVKHATPKTSGLKNLIKEFISSKNKTAYNFWRETNLSQGTAYRLCNEPDFIPSGATIKTICTTYRIQPDSILQWVPEHDD